MGRQTRSTPIVTEKKKKKISRRRWVAKERPETGPIRGSSNGWKGEEGKTAGFYSLVSIGWFWRVKSRNSPPPSSPPSSRKGRERRRDGLSAQRQIFISHRRRFSLGAHGPYYRDKWLFRRLISTRMIDCQMVDTPGFCRFITRTSPLLSFCVKSTRIVHNC